MIMKSLLVRLIFTLQMSLVSLFSISYDGVSKEPPRSTVNKTIKKLEELFHLNGLPQSYSGPHKKAPKFMLDLYDAVADSYGTPRNHEVLEGNVVRSFEDKGHTGERFHFFNLSSFARDEKMIKAEFRWFRQKQRQFGGMSYGPHFYKVDLYEVLDSRVKPWRGNLITSRLVPIHTQGWEVFNVTQTVSKWIRNSEENNGVLVVTTLPSGDWVEYVVSSPGEDKDAYLVIFSDDGRPGTTNHQSPKLGHANHVAESGDQEKNRARRRREAPSYLRNRPLTCQRVPLFVDFEEIGWSGWIISPRGYNTYHCKGSCPFPLGENLRATNHATVQSIMYALKVSNEVDTPCCVPDKLQSISLLYFDDDENVVLKQYDDMVAISCGCH
ncbi:bone morphogenetic protein 2-like [Hypomesus transpacificus]|uniref:bone morphogenetic protein 2-like n=1 Tax=Hypomesus transpacificus TaxID=137520 RepID=UPI001F074687|nr:bone morphogenetic protein 2-like [Hypomesus transpacificus]XP_046870602.1 bone morphogenetic protein 2-like [Hypomesus transpacificus]